MAMEPHCERRRPPLHCPPPHPHPHPRSSRPRKPSFAASLLDAIYRSLDADPPAVADPDPDPRKRKTTTRSDPHLALIAADVRPRPSSASSSAPSDSSSFGFSSDAEHPRHRTAPRRPPTRRDPPPPTPPRANPTKPAKPAKPSSIRSRIREFRKGRRGAPSPAPLSCLLRAIFSSAGIARKHKPRAPPPPPPPPLPPPPPPPPQSRSVRFGAVSVVGEGERVPGDADLAAETRWRRVEELMRVMRAMRKEEEEEEDEEGSDSSSDLFELAIACDELPVYETTHPTTINRSSAPGLLIT